MTIQRKKCLAAGLGSAAMAVFFGLGATSLKAQDGVPKTPQEAAQLFGRLLIAQEKGEATPTSSEMKSLAIARDGYSKLSASGLDSLLMDLQKASRPTGFIAANPKQEDGRTVVEISPVQATGIPLVIVAERGGYCVDLIATYAKAMRLGEGAYQKRIFEKTGVIFPGLPDANAAAVQSRACIENLKALQTAVRLYSEAHGGKYPPADKWTEALREYARNPDVFNCPTAPGGKWGYAFNANLSEQMVSKLKKPDDTTVFYETSDLKPNANGTGDDVVFRHKDSEAGALLGHETTGDGKVRDITSTDKLEFRMAPPVRKMRH
jgi:hypothetical protein